MKKRLTGISRGVLSALIVMSSAIAFAQQAPAPGGRGGPPRPTFWVSTSAWPDGGEIPMKHSSRADNKSPAFEFNWNIGGNPGAAPETVKTYAVILRDMENSSNRTTTDTLHWSVFNIPGTAKGIPEGLAAGDLPDGTRNGPGAGARGGNPPVYVGPGAPPGPFHHYAFEFYALDTKLELPATATRDELLKAMDSHVVGKAVWFGRFHFTPPPAAK